jgi:hypothetical protein
MRDAPTRSSCRIFSFQVASTGFAAWFGLKEKKVTMAAMPPTGRLIQKHCDAVRMGGCCMQRYPERPTQRQVSLSVKAPPSRGPMTAAIAYMAPTIPRYCGRLEGGVASPTMLNRPTVTPEPPTPWIARPTISVLGFFATAHTMLPSSKIKMPIKYHTSMGMYL